ncbi:hypothetical protein [Streptomyces sp. NPDC001275]
MTQNLNPLFTTLYVKIDDEIGRRDAADGTATAADRIRARLPCHGAGTGPGTPLAQRDGEVFQICAHTVPSAGLLGIATAAT